jgi:septum formation protein
VKLLLASGSATRRQMLERAGVSFEVVQPEADEEAFKRSLLEAGNSSRAIAQHLAALKAMSVSAPDDGFVLGSDQTLEQENGDMLSKPGSREEARSQLAALSGRRHQLHSAAVLAAGGEIVWSDTESVELTMRPLRPTFIDAYLDSEYNAVRHNVGCYRIEGMGAQLFERVNGSHFAVLGLPLLPLLAELRRRGMLAS